ncbi:MAG: hypothetical protein EBT00_17335, partial [Proteobacteria bacterium]|nr:hypothetical protein [Pseudomonadota bacterium]
YGTATSTFVPNIPVTMTVVDGDGGPLGASLTMPSSASRTFTVKLDSGANTVQGATVRVSTGGGSGTGGYAGSAFNVCGTSQDSCGYGSQEYVVHWETPASQTFTVGTFTIYGRQCETMADTPCEGDLVVSLVDAQGVDASGHRATFSAPVQVREVDVLPPLPVALRLTGPQTIKASATASFAVSLDVGAATVSQATVTISVAETQDSQNREYVCQTLAPDGRCPRIVAGETDNTPWFLSMPFNNQGSGTAVAIGTFFYEANRTLGTREINAQVSFRDASNNVAYGLDAMGHQIEFVQDPATGMHDVKIEPNVTYTLHTSLSPDGKSVSATATFNFGDWEINKGHVDIAY